MSATDEDPCIYCTMTMQACIAKLIDKKMPCCEHCNHGR